MQTLGIGFIIGLTLCMVSCSRPKTVEKIYGVYEADYDVAHEKVTLSKDNTFTQEVTLKNTGKVDVAKGTWKYDPNDGYITLENFMAVLDGLRKFNPDYTQPKSGLTSQPVDSFFGRIYIGSSEGVMYKKK